MECSDSISHTQSGLHCSSTAVCVQALLWLQHIVNGPLTQVIHTLVTAEPASDDMSAACTAALLLDAASACLKPSSGATAALFGEHSVARIDAAQGSAHAKLPAIHDGSKVLHLHESVLMPQANALIGSTAAVHCAGSQLSSLQLHAGGEAQSTSDAAVLLASEVAIDEMEACGLVCACGTCPHAHSLAPQYLGVPLVFAP